MEIWQYGEGGTTTTPGTWRRGEDGGHGIVDTKEDDPEEGTKAISERFVGVSKANEGREVSREPWRHERMDRECQGGRIRRAAVRAGSEDGREGGGCVAPPI